MSCPHCEKNGASGASSFSEEERKNGVPMITFSKMKADKMGGK